jgi:hypothetical protein
VPLLDFPIAIGANKVGAFDAKAQGIQVQLGRQPSPASEEKLVGKPLGVKMHCHKFSKVSALVYLLRKPTT